MVYSLTWLPEVLEAADLKVAEVPGWRSRGRGDMGTVRGVLCHHTAGPKAGNMPSLKVVTEGRPGLNGPLAQLGLGRDGTYYVVAAGRANHAGRGIWQGETRGNSHFIGIEAGHTGAMDEGWPDVQLEAYRRGVAALLKRIGASASWCCGHREYALPVGRKPDPTFDMGTFRRDVDEVLSGVAAPPVLIPAIDAQQRPTLRRGARGDWVKRIQAAVGVAMDGIFGAQTDAKVREFQRSHDLVPDGIVGPRTWLHVE